MYEDIFFRVFARADAIENYSLSLLIHLHLLLRPDIPDLQSIVK